MRVLEPHRERDLVAQPAAAERQWLDAPQGVTHRRHARFGESDPAQVFGEAQRVGRGVALVQGHDALVLEPVNGPGRRARHEGVDQPNPGLPAPQRGQSKRIAAEDLDARVSGEASPGQLLDNRHPGPVVCGERVAQADDDVMLVIGGKLPERDDPLFFDPRPLIEALGISGDVHLIGWVDEAHKPALYRGAACAVFASRYEGFGLPVLEALACGTPLVTSNTSSLPELLGDAGFAVDPGDVQGLAGAILSCLVDDPLAAELRRRGPQQAARFTWMQTARQTLEAYRDAVAGGG